MKIGGVIEDLIKLYINDPKSLQKMIDELKDEETRKSLRTQMFEAVKK